MILGTRAPARRGRHRTVLEEVRPTEALHKWPLLAGPGRAIREGGVVLGRVQVDDDGELRAVQGLLPRRAFRERGAAMAIGCAVQEGVATAQRDVVGAPCPHPGVGGSGVGQGGSLPLQPVNPA